MNAIVQSVLPRKATLVSVVVRQWTARKLDRKVTDEVNDSHGASKDAGRYNKLLLAPERMKPVTKVTGEARMLHYRYTKPWADEGLRILPNSLHMKFANEFRVLKREWETVIADFVRDYEVAVKERAAELNGLFNPADYPDPREIASKFELDYKTYPVPDVGDFRSEGLDAETIEDLKRELAKTNEQVLGTAMQDSVEQVKKLVGHMSTKLREFAEKDPETKTYFKDSLVENVRELADLLPAFNLTADPNFDKVAGRIKGELCEHDADELREDANVRGVVIKSADSILRDVSMLLA